MSYSSKIQPEITIFAPLKADANSHNGLADSAAILSRAAQTDTIEKLRQCCSEYGVREMNFFAAPANDEETLFAPSVSFQMPKGTLSPDEQYDRLVEVTDKLYSILGIGYGEDIRLQVFPAMVRPELRVLHQRETIEGLGQIQLAGPSPTQALGTG